MPSPRVVVVGQWWLANGVLYYLVHTYILAFSRCAYPTAAQIADCSNCKSSGTPFSNLLWVANPISSPSNFAPQRQLQYD